MNRVAHVPNFTREMLTHTHADNLGPAETMTYREEPQINDHYYHLENIGIFPGDTLEMAIQRFANIIDQQRAEISDLKLRLDLAEQKQEKTKVQVNFNLKQRT